MKKYNLRLSAYLIISCFLLACSFFFTACKTKSTDTSDNNNSGKTSIAADINLRSLADQMKVCYENMYPEAHIDPVYQPQDSVIQNFVTGKINTIIISGNLSGNEKQSYEELKQFKPEEYVFAYNAMAFVTAKDLNTTTISFPEIKKMLQPGSGTKLVFDNPKSGIAKQLAQQLNISPDEFKNALVVKNTEEVIDYVNRSEHSIGCIPFAYFSNENEPRSKAILSKIKVLKIEHNDSIYTLSQRTISTGQYPFIMPVNMVLGRSSNLDRDFMHFIYRRQVSKIIEKEGLVPVNFPQRNVIVRDELTIH